MVERESGILFRIRGFPKNAGVFFAGLFSQLLSDLAPHSSGQPG